MFYLIHPGYAKSTVKPSAKPDDDKSSEKSDAKEDSKAETTPKPTTTEETTPKPLSSTSTSTTTSPSTSTTTLRPTSSTLPPYIYPDYKVVSFEMPHKGQKTTPISPEMTTAIWNHLNSLLEVFYPKKIYDNM